MCTFLLKESDKMNEYFMNLAIKQANKAKKLNEIPVGCIITKNNKIIAKSHNLKEKKQCVTYHAEILAIKKASKKIKNWRLNDCNIYITMKPCPMCASAIKQARIKKIYYLIDNKNNDISDIILKNQDINGKVEIEKLEYNNLIKNNLKNFFDKKRKFKLRKSDNKNNI